MSSIITRSKLELAPHSSPTRAELFLVKERWSGSPRQRHECHDEVKELVKSILPKRFPPPYCYRCKSLRVHTGTASLVLVRFTSNFWIAGSQRLK